MPTCGDLLRGIVVETTTGSWLGPYFYSDQVYVSPKDTSGSTEPLLNGLSQISFVGIAAGVARMALATIHTLGHLFAALLTLDLGHYFHAVKGGAEFLRGFIEAIPFLGRGFAELYCKGGLWWIVKIYNPIAPDSLDYRCGYWESFKQIRPTGYVIA